MSWYVRMYAQVLSTTAELFLLKQGKATVIQRAPFAIQLTEKTTEYTQDIVVEIDDGGIHVGVACVANDKSIYQEEIQ